MTTQPDTTPKFPLLDLFVMCGFFAVLALIAHVALENYAEAKQDYQQQKVQSTQQILATYKAIVFLQDPPLPNQPTEEQLWQEIWVAWHENHPETNLKNADQLKNHFQHYSNCTITLNGKDSDVTMTPQPKQSLF